MGKRKDKLLKLNLEGPQELKEEGVGTYSVVEIDGGGRIREKASQVRNSQLQEGKREGEENMCGTRKSKRKLKRIRLCDVLSYN